MKVNVCDSWFCHVFNSDVRSCVCMKVNVCGSWFCHVFNSDVRSCVCMKVNVNVLRSPSVIVRTVSVDVKQHSKTELRSCVIVDVDVLGSPRP